MNAAGGLVGHKRLGRLPKRQRWNEVVGLLDRAPNETAAVANATALAAEQRLRELARDPLLAYCFWLLARIASASTHDDFPGALRDIGLTVDDGTSALAFIAEVADEVRREVSLHPESGPFAEIAGLALTRALSETVGTSGPGLFGSSVHDLQAAVRTHATRDRFGDLAQRFFGNFLARTLTHFVDRELAAHVGPTHPLRDIRSSAEFLEALEVHARQSAVIVKDFAGGWRSRRDWETRGRITEQDARRFVAVALGKLRSELELRDA